MTVVHIHTKDREAAAKVEALLGRGLGYEVRVEGEGWLGRRVAQLCEDAGVDITDSVHAMLATDNSTEHARLLGIERGEAMSREVMIGAYIVGEAAAGKQSGVSTASERRLWLMRRIVDLPIQPKVCPACGGLDHEEVEGGGFRVICMECSHTWESEREEVGS